MRSHKRVEAGSWTRNLMFGALMSAGLVSVSAGVQAQNANISGVLGSFDVVNMSGQPAHGFEIQMEGATANDLYYTGFGGRYGVGKVVPYATGVYVRWSGNYSAVTSAYSATTPAHTGAVSFSWQDCYLGGAGYAASGCEALSQSLRYPWNANVVVSGRWLVDDPVSPGNIVSLNPPVTIPLMVTYTVVPPAIVSAPPVVVAVVEPPEPPETPEIYGNAQWI